MCPNRQLNPQPRHVFWPGIEPATFWCMGQCSNQPTHLARAKIFIFCCVHHPTASPDAMEHLYIIYTLKVLAFSIWLTITLKLEHGLVWEAVKTKTQGQNRTQECLGHLEIHFLFWVGLLCSLFHSSFLKQGEYGLAMRLPPCYPVTQRQCHRKCQLSSLIKPPCSQTH